MQTSEPGTGWQLDATRIRCAFSTRFVWYLEVRFVVCKD